MQWGTLIAVILLVGWFFFGWFKSPVYTGYFYYDPTNLDLHWKQDGLVSLDACRDWVDAQVSRDSDGQYDYECGKNCKPSEVISMDTCETTEN